MEDEMSDSDGDAASDDSVLVDTDVHNKPVDIWTSLSEVYESLFKVEKRYSRMNSTCKPEEHDPNKSKTTSAVAGDEQSEEFLLDEMKSTFERCIAQNIEHSNTLLEFNSLKHAYAIGITDFCFFLIKALLEVVDEKVESKAVNAVFVKELRAHVEHFKTILETYFNNDVEAQSICLESIEDTCVLNESIMNRCLWILYRFYEEDILEEEEILKWYESSAMLSDEDTCEKAELMRQKLNPFIKWLKEGSEASSSSGSSEESSDGEEDNK